MILNLLWKQIRLITGYGPQEDWNDEDKASFFMALDKEISKALADRKSVFVAMDAICKMGFEYIPQDLNIMSKNGEILAELLI